MSCLTLLLLQVLISISMSIEVRVFEYHCVEKHWGRRKRVSTILRWTSIIVVFHSGKSFQIPTCAIQYISTMEYFTTVSVEIGEIPTAYLTLLVIRRLVVRFVRSTLPFSLKWHIVADLLFYLFYNQYQCDCFYRRRRSCATDRIYSYERAPTPDARLFRTVNSIISYPPWKEETSNLT